MVKDKSREETTAAELTAEESGGGFETGVEFRSDTGERRQVTKDVRWETCKSDGNLRRAISAADHTYPEACTAGKGWA